MKKRADGRYSVSMMIDGKRHYFYGKTRAEVYEKARKFKEVQKHGPLYSDAADEWWSRTVEKVSPSTARGYQAAFTRSKNYFKQPVTEIRAADVSAFILDTITEYDLGFKAASSHLLVVRSVLSYAVNRGYVDINVARDVTVPKDLRRTKRTAASSEEVERMKALPPSTMKTFAMLALYAGLRRGEIIPLRWSDVDLDAGTIRISKAVAYDGWSPVMKTPKTAASLAEVPILPQLDEYLRQIRKKTGLVCPNRHGKIYANQQEQRDFWAWSSENDFHFTLHQLRHYFATALWESDVPPDEAQILLRHSSLGMTMNVYREIRKEKTERIFERARAITF